MKTVEAVQGKVLQVQMKSPEEIALYLITTGTTEGKGPSSKTLLVCPSRNL